jgi:hypothetical protein
MSYCPDCGAEIGDAPQCPLCGARNPRAGTGPDSEKSCAEPTSEKFSDLRFMLKDAEEEFSGAEKRTIAWEVLSVAFCIAILVLGAVNLFESRQFSWSLYPIVSILLVWVEATSFLVLRKMPVFRVLLSVLAPPVFLMVLGFISKSPRWALGLAVPIAVLVESLTGAVSLVIGKSRQKGLNLIACVLVAIVALCIGLEVFIDLFSRGAVVLEWAPVCAIALLPIAAFLLYLHYRVIKITNLRRLFHL